MNSVNYDVSKDIEAADSDEDQDEGHEKDESNNGYGAEQAKITENAYVWCD